MKKRTKDQQIRHLKATIGGLVRALRYADDAIGWSRHQRIMAQEQLRKFLDRVGPDLRKKEAEDMQKMAYELGFLLPDWAQRLTEPKQ